MTERWYFAIRRVDLMAIGSAGLLALLCYDAVTVERSATLDFYVFSNEGGPSRPGWLSYGVTEIYADRDEARLLEICREREKRAGLLAV